MDIANNNNGIVKTSYIESIGISSKTITTLVRKKQLKKISKGIYTVISFKDKYYIYQSRCRKGIYSHESALYLNNLIKQEPKIYNITIVSHYNTRIITNEECKYYYLKEDMVDVGKTEIYTKDNNLVVSYDTERGLLDLVILRKKANKNVEYDKIIHYFKLYLKSKQKNIQKLYEYAQKLDVVQELEYILAVIT